MQIIVFNVVVFDSTSFVVVLYREKEKYIFSGLVCAVMIYIEYVLIAKEIFSKKNIF